MNDNKIILNKKTDLLKLTVSQILNTKIYNFKGPYFNQLYDEAIKLEESNSRKKKAFSKVSYNIEFIQFDVKFLSEVRFIFYIVWSKDCYYWIREYYGQLGS